MRREQGVCQFTKRKIMHLAKVNRFVAKSYEVSNDQQMINELSQLQDHPFNLIGLADREKFHTGMLSFLLNSLLEHDEVLFRELVLRLWQINTDLPETNATTVVVEKNGIDLAILNGSIVTHWAEVKLKTGLGNEQIQRYEKKHPKSNGVLLGLFPEDTGSDKTEFRSFPKVISEFLHPSKLASIANSELQTDRFVLIKMWSEYLTLLSKLADHFVSRNFEIVEKSDEIRQLLRNIKLLGIFERYRYGLIACELAQIQKKIAPELFNSNGNAGIHLQIAGEFPYGLQWQAGALKFFVIDPNYIKGNPADKRDAILYELSSQYIGHFKLPLSNKLNQKGKFRSVTVQRWDILHDCKGRAQFLADSIEYLCAIKI